MCLSIWGISHTQAPPPPPPPHLHLTSTSISTSTSTYISTSTFINTTTITTTSTSTCTSLPVCWSYMCRVRVRVRGYPAHACGSLLPTPGGERCVEMCRDVRVWEVGAYRAILPEQPASKLLCNLKTHKDSRQLSLLRVRSINTN
jgi:hypothetical protein